MASDIGVVDSWGNLLQTEDAVGASGSVAQ